MVTFHGRKWSTVFAALFLLPLTGAWAENSVILISLDGVRPEEVQRSLLPETLKLVERDGFLVGKKLKGIESGGSMKVSNRAAMSLPGYRAIFAGRFDSSCMHNHCGQVKDPTLLDDLAQIGLARSDSAVFASWKRLARAITSTDEAVEGTTAFYPFHSERVSPPTNRIINQFLEAANRLRPPWQNSRWDHYTWEIALRYLDEVEPRLTYLSFVDSDEWAHLGQKGSYRASLRQFDHRFQQLRALLAKTPGRLERTSFVITTDHGRGRGLLWSQHERRIPHSKNIFAMVIPSKNLRTKYRYEMDRSGLQSQVRATVEELLEPGRELWKAQRRKAPLFQTTPTQEIISSRSAGPVDLE